MEEEKLTAFLKANPYLGGVALMIFGIACLLCAVFNASWLFGNTSGVTYSMKKVDGLVNWFGRRNARIIFGIGSVFIIFLGVLLTVLLID